MLKTTNMKNKLIVAAVLLAAAAVLTAAIGLTGNAPAMAATNDQATKRTINVTGQGTVDATPDIANITLGMVTEDKDGWTKRNR